ncbi:MAG: efflux RND transporter periplasmic adaptor subunit, partial [Victivallaceae bacterium]
MKIKRMTIYSLIALLLIGVALTAYKYFGRPAVTPEPVSRIRVVKLAQIADDEPALGVTYPGKVRPVKHAELFFRVSGPVIERNLKYGQTVEPGEVLMRIDPRDYQREVDRLKQELETQKLQASLADIEFKRQQQLLNSKATSQSAFDSAQTKKQTSDAQVKTLELSLKIAQDKLQDTILIAPFHGTISDLRIEQYEIAAANVPVVVLDDLRELEIKISMPAGNLPNFGFDNAKQFLGMQFDVSFPGRGSRMFKAAIYEFKPIASEESETYQLTLHMKTPSDFLILPGMSCE